MKYWRKPLDYDQVKIPRGEVIIIAERCKGCAFCVEFCPKDVLAMSDTFNSKGYHPPYVVKHGECVNCNLCEMICPEFAIYSVSVNGDVAISDEKPEEHFQEGVASDETAKTNKDSGEKTQEHSVEVAASTKGGDK